MPTLPEGKKYHRYTAQEKLTLQTWLDDQWRLLGRFWLGQIERPEGMPDKWQDRSERYYMAVEGFLRHSYYRLRLKPPTEEPRAYADQ